MGTTKREDSARACTDEESVDAKQGARVPYRLAKEAIRVRADPHRRRRRPAHATGLREVGKERGQLRGGEGSGGGRWRWRRGGGQGSAGAGERGERSIR